MKISAQEKARLTHLIKATMDSRASERLQLILNATSGKYTLQDLSSLAQRSRATVQTWLAAYANGGLEQLLVRGKSPGRGSPVAGAKIRNRLAREVDSGRLKTAAEISAWLEAEFGIYRARKSIYYWLNKLSLPGRE